MRAGEIFRNGAVFRKMCRPLAPRAEMHLAERDDYTEWTHDEIFRENCISKASPDPSHVAFPRAAGTVNWYVSSYGSSLAAERLATARIALKRQAVGLYFLLSSEYSCAAGRRRSDRAGTAPRAWLAWRRVIEPRREAFFSASIRRTAACRSRRNRRNRATPIRSCRLSRLLPAPRHRRTPCAKRWSRS